MLTIVKYAISACCLAAAAIAQGDDVADGKARLDFMKQSAADYAFTMNSAGKTKAELLAEPVLRWNNKVVEEEDAALFLWVHDKRPVCAAQFFLQHGKWHHEFQSLTDERFIGEWRGKVPWKWVPAQLGVRFAPANLELPADRPAARLRQMRYFAERFTAAVDPSRSGKFDDPHQLRLLPTPVYRYADERHGLVDGAMFAFAQGTNPEVLLLVEARRSKGGVLAWQHSFAPMTSFEARVNEQDRVIWQQEMAPVPTVDRQDVYQFRWAVLEAGEKTVPTPAAVGRALESSN